MKLNIKKEVCIRYSINEKEAGEVFVGETVNDKPVLTITTSKAMFDASPEEALCMAYAIIEAASELV